MEQFLLIGFGLIAIIIAIGVMADIMFRRKVTQPRDTFSYKEHVKPRVSVPSGGKTPPPPPPKRIISDDVFRSGRPQRSHSGTRPSSHDDGSDLTTLAMTAALLSDSEPAPRTPEPSPCSSSTTDTSSSCFVGSYGGSFGSSSSGFSSSSSYDSGSSFGSSGSDSSF